MSPHVPACAGFTSGTRSRRSRTWDHPRSRGVYDRDFKAAGDVLGSSPLARGLLGPLGPADIAYGIIPARAGFTAGPCRYRTGSWDHPRSRGVYTEQRRRPASDRGSSPLARGLRRREQGRLTGRGIIPARAGFTQRLPGAGPGRRDHPRSRGVYNETEGRDTDVSGSSPLARGLQPGQR